MNDAVNLIMDLSKEISKFKKGKAEETVNAKSIKELIYSNWKNWLFGNIDENKPLTRIQFARLLDEILHPFESMDVNHFGSFTQNIN